MFTLYWCVPAGKICIDNAGTLRESALYQYETPCTCFWRIQTEESNDFFPVIISDYKQSFFIETSKLLKCTEGCDSIEKPNKRPHFDEGFMSNRWRPLGLSGCLVNFYFQESAGRYTALIGSSKNKFLTTYVLT